MSQGSKAKVHSDSAKRAAATSKGIDAGSNMQKQELIDALKQAS
ncbi:MULTISPECIES: hypothetical protein [Pseudomonas]|uniref:Uncharacterized protein n=1 Tax=Pseudomonas fluorescens TaxID=294 RepID=A0A5E6XG50_PSEFL|nr:MULTISPECIES: hypothetical protein [Pseudomonas]VVN39557.1 hypothetical protein PS652_05339 [Pseudomonas fluorescens]